ncbi:TPA: hypothetical protein IAB29_03500 [Candidatus Ventrenecus stercoripullorum]|nr:hypothetical protein [Candidatus Ventrenecus stercoripullorum]
METNYFLIINIKGKATAIYLDNNPRPYVDISEIDLQTMQYSREEIIEFARQKISDLQKLPPEKLNLCDIYVLRVREDKKHKFHLKFYECIYKTSGISIEECAEERLNRIQYNLGRQQDEAKVSIDISASPHFHRLVKTLLDGLIGDSKFLYSIIMRKSFLNDHFMDILRELSKPHNYHNMNYYNYVYPELQKELKSYKQLRGLFLEYKYFYHSLQRQKPSERYNALYSSDVFSYTDGFYLQKYNADNDPNKTFFWDQMDSNFQLLDDLKAISILEKVKREPFQNKELEKWYYFGGIEAIFMNMDTNEIYPCSKEDLVRAGIISNNDYLQYLYKKYENQQRSYK